MHRPRDHWAPACAGANGGGGASAQIQLSNSNKNSAPVFIRARGFARSSLFFLSPKARGMARRDGAPVTGLVRLAPDLLGRISHRMRPRLSARHAAFSLSR